MVHRSVSGRVWEASRLQVDHRASAGHRIGNHFGATWAILGAIWDPNRVKMVSKVGVGINDGNKLKLNAKMNLKILKNQCKKQ